MNNKKFEKYIGKPVATRGIGSGVNVGILVYFNEESRTVILKDSYFLRRWSYKNSYGSMASLSSGDILTTGEHEITKVHSDSIIINVECLVVVPQKVLDVCEKIAK